MSYSCPACGYAMDAFDTECPRCHGKGIDKPAPVTAPIKTTSPGGTTVLPGTSGGGPMGASLPVQRFTIPPERHPVRYIFCAIAFGVAYFAPWWALKLVEGKKISGAVGLEIIAVAAAALAAVLMLIDSMQGEKELPWLPQARSLLSTGCLAFAGGEILYALMLNNVISLSFGLPIMLVAAAVMVVVDFLQIGEDTRPINMGITATALVAVLAFSAYQGNSTRQITNAFAGLAGAFNRGGITTPDRPKPEVEITINSSTQSSSLPTVSDGFDPFTPKAGKIFLICNVTVKFKSGGEDLRVNYSDIEMTASNKNVYHALKFFQALKNVNPLSAKLLPEGSATGDVVFEVDSGAQAEKIEYVGF